MTDPRYAHAAAHVERLTGLAAHAASFVLVNVAIFSGTGFRPTAGHFWGWGIGLAAHALVVLGPGARARRRLIEWQLARLPAGEELRPPQDDPRR